MNEMSQRTETAVATCRRHIIS